jgi:hypothetical protein
MTKLCPRGKAAAKRKFKVYPSAYANAYASKICAGTIKDPSGVKRKDFKGPKPSGGGGTSAGAKKVRKAVLGLLFLRNQRKIDRKKRRKEPQEQQTKQVNPVTGKAASQPNMSSNEKMMTAIKNMRKPFGMNVGGDTNKNSKKIKKAGLGLMMLAGKKNRRKAGKQMKKSKLNMLSPGLYGMTQLQNGGMPEATGSYIQQDIDGESFTNPSTQAYYKDLLK